MTYSNYLTVKHFKSVIDKDQHYSERDVRQSTKLLKHGIFMKPSAVKLFSNDEIEDMIYDFGIDLKNVNSTFYKTFNEMKSKSEFELRFDQILHYLSTYGEIEELRNHGDIFEPRSLDLAEIQAAQRMLKLFVIIESVTKEQFTDKLQSLIYSGIALNSEKVTDLVTIINLHKIEFDIDKIKNKELKVILSYNLNLVIDDIDFTMRALVYGLTGNTQIVKNQDLYLIIAGKYNYDYRYQESPRQFKSVSEYLLKYFNEFGIDDAIKSANRYRKLWLVIRKSIRNNCFVKRSVDQSDQSDIDKQVVSLINKVLRLSKKGHEVTKQSAIDLMTSGSLSIIEIQKAIENMSIYQLARIYNAVSEKIAFVKQSERVRLFKIRNGKTFLKHEKDVKDQSQVVDNLQSTLFLIKNQIKKTLNLSDKIVIDNGFVNYAVPTSEKNFFGALPDFSIVEFDNAARIGVAWKEEGDIDLHAQSVSGKNIGWFASYRNEDISYSGDMTSLNKHGFAAEYFDIKSNLNDVYNLNLNLYRSGGRLNDFDVIIGDSVKEKIMHDLNSIKFKIKQDFNKTSSMSIGLIMSINDKLCYVASNTNFKANMVPDTKTISLALEAIKRKATTRLMMKDIYQLTGVKVVSSIDEVEESDLDKVIDLTIENLTTDKFTTLFS